MLVNIPQKGEATHSSFVNAHKSSNNTAGLEKHQSRDGMICQGRMDKIQPQCMSSNNSVSDVVDNYSFCSVIALLDVKAYGFWESTTTTNTTYINGYYDRRAPKPLLGRLKPRIGSRSSNGAPECVKINALPTLEWCMRGSNERTSSR